MGEIKTTQNLRPALQAHLEALNDAYEAAKARRAERIKAADDQFRLEVQALEEERDLASKLLTFGDRRVGGPAQMPEAGRPPTTPPGDFFVRAVKATGPKTKEEFLKLAKDAGYQIDGRGVHATIVNSMRGGRLEPRDDGRYGIPASEPGELALERETPF